MDRGIWAIWYDLPARGKEEYIAWLHGVHLPEALARPGYLWAAHVENIWDEARKKAVSGRVAHTDDPSVPGGNSYLLLYGAASPHVFFNPSPSELEARWTAEERRMFGRRAGARSCIFVEEARAEGPEVRGRAPGLTPGPVIQLGTFNSKQWENEEEIGAWYAQSRLPIMASTPGCVGTRKLVSVCGWAKHAILYEFVSMEAVEKHFVGHAGSRDPVAERQQWTDRVVWGLIHAPGSPSLGMRIWPPAHARA